MTSHGATPVRRSAVWLLLAVGGLACSSRSLQTDGGRDGRAGADSPGAGAGHGGTAGSTTGAGAGGGGASGSLGIGGSSAAGSDSGATVETDANDGGAGKGTGAVDGGAATQTDSRDGDAAETDASADGATVGTDGRDAGDLLCGGMTLYGLSTGDSCFDVVAVAPGANDGCLLGVSDAPPGGIVGTALPLNYDLWAGVVSVGTMGALGVGEVRCNAGTLAREASPTLDTMPACTWHQTDSSVLHMTATNELDLSVTEVQSAFTGCSAANAPPGGQCTSTWTWHLKKGIEAWPSCR